MSEIFSWLKRAELEKRKEVQDFADSKGKATDVHLADLEVVACDMGDLAPDSTPNPAKIETRKGIRFDLTAADQRIRTVFDPLTLIGEQYRLVRAKLARLQKERGFKTLLVTSSVPVEGKTFTACCLAGVFAQEPGKRVLLIDADLRKPRAGQSLGMSNARHSEGLSQVLQGEKEVGEVLLSSENMEFFLLPSGPVPDDPSALLSSPNLERVVKEMAAVFDWVVIDSPPVVGLADATIIAPLCDAVILVIQSGKTSSKLVKESIERIGRERFCGVMLNRGKHVRGSRYYYHYYHKDGDRRP